MAFSSYTDLQTAIGQWLSRDDLATYIPDFITLFEAHAARRLKVRPMESSTTLTPSSGSATLPSDYLGYKRATVTSSERVEMLYVHPSYLQALYPSGISDIPKYFTIEGGAIKTRSSDSNNIELLYFAKNSAVSSSLNWLFNNHPDAYLFGSLVEAETFVQDDERMPMFKARRDEVFAEILQSDFRERGQMHIRVGGAHP